MFAELLLATAFQVGPFYEQKDEAFALRPFVSREGEVTDVLWPLFTSHRDWWRCLFVLHEQSNDKGWQFDLLPLFWVGREEENVYGGLFPLYGTHPHVLFLDRLSFVLWPLYTRYENLPRNLTTHAVLWPFFHWRDDGSFGVWPLYVSNHQRESFHQTALWPLVTWARYEEDRDTAGAGSSWMLWPLYGQVRRRRESQHLVLPPLFSYARTLSTRGEEEGVRVRAPWPLFEYERTPRRTRLSVFPFYERLDHHTYEAESSTSSITRFGWKLVELYPDETRVFPFWVSRSDGSYFRLWPFWETTRGEDGAEQTRVLSLFPIRHVPVVDRNWAKFWTFYESRSAGGETRHSLLWGLIQWTTSDD